ncbi:hypothetical protein Bca4012_053125 [Brassica carinata]|uniref:Uncharacterized protein n=3 Tax=Brassica TaxID=3705 RepID=A0A0D3AYJ4_BRAOL|nr:unnamed protein product [Brassica napus]VDD27354.1 unnamed protein product [Brassica oleracea]
MFAMFCNVFYFRALLSLNYQKKQGKINVRMIYTLFKSRKREESKSAKSTCKPR